MDLTPELLAALQAYMAGAGAPAAAAPRPAQASARGRVLPSEIISLDDAEFGRY
jgi:hypothetical protein